MLVFRGVCEDDLIDFPRWDIRDLSLEGNYIHSWVIFGFRCSRLIIGPHQSQGLSF